MRCAPAGAVPDGRARGTPPFQKVSIWTSHMRSAPLLVPTYGGPIRPSAVLYCSFRISAGQKLSGEGSMGMRAVSIQ